jgi:quinol monooxygenase YgiN
MFARVTTVDSAPEQFDGVVRLYRETIVPFTLQQEGCKGIHLLADRETGRVLTISLWKDDAAMRASEDMATQLRTQSRMAGYSPERVERYEVVD